MYKSCYYCGLIIEVEKFPEKCPKCNTHTRWQTKEQCIKSVIETENRRWLSSKPSHNNDFKTHKSSPKLDFKLLKIIEGLSDESKKILKEKLDKYF